MIVFPNCKINLGLKILDKREDSFHNLETIFYPVPLKDALEIIPFESKEQVIFNSSGNLINGETKDNLCLRAYYLLKKDFPYLPAVKIHLHKNIPMGAGLGGGSADAAFTLQLLNKLFTLNITTEKLHDYSLQLGSDCPFFIINAPCIGTGRGEVLQEIELDLSGYKIVLVNPSIHVNTGEAFSNLNLAPKSLSMNSLKNKIQQPIETWKYNVENDFELPVFKKYPVIKNIKEHLYHQGAAYAAMSGTGSTVFGFFKKDTQLNLQFDSSFIIHELFL